MGRGEEWEFAVLSFLSFEKALSPCFRRKEGEKGRGKEVKVRYSRPSVLGRFNPPVNFSPNKFGGERRRKREEGAETNGG